jgi:hypothetical protein
MCGGRSRPLVSSRLAASREVPGGGPAGTQQGQSSLHIAHVPSEQKSHVDWSAGYRYRLIWSSIASSRWRRSRDSSGSMAYQARTTACRPRRTLDAHQVWAFTDEKKVRLRVRLLLGTSRSTGRGGGSATRRETVPARVES